MINVTTGLPGASKTLHTLSTVEKRRLKENRAVYYYGIKELKLDWIELTLEQAQKWWELPAGAIIVLDEAQKLFPPRPNGAPVPRMEAELETHRHSGYDFYLVTQDVGFLPAHLRKLIQTHKHLMCKFGTPWVTIHQFEGARDNVSKSRKDSIETQWLRDSSMYDKYKSAEIHTQKVRVPFKVWVAMLLPFVLIGGAYYFYQKRLTGTVPGAPASSSVAPAAGPVAKGRVTESKAAPVAPPRVYDLASFAPRIEGLPHTAPRYDELTAPVRVPTIVGCVWLPKSKRGHCYTQQGTKTFPGEAFIKQYVENGMFEDYERGPELGYVVAGRQVAPDAAKPVTRPPPADLPSLTAMSVRPVLEPVEAQSTVARDGDVLKQMRKREYIK